MTLVVPNHPASIIESAPVERDGTSPSRKCSSGRHQDEKAFRLFEHPFSASFGQGGQTRGTVHCDHGLGVQGRALAGVLLTGLVLLSISPAARSQNSPEAQYQAALELRRRDIDASVANRVRQIVAQAKPKIESLGFDEAFFGLPIIVPNGIEYSRLDTPQSFLALVLATEPGTEARSIRRNDNPGFSLKKPGSPTENYVFRRDGNELYLTAYGQFDEVRQLVGLDAARVGAALSARRLAAVETIRAQVAQQFEPIPRPASPPVRPDPTATGGPSGSAGQPGGTAATSMNLDNTLERLRALQAQNAGRPSPGSLPASENASLSAAARGTIGDRIRECFTGDAASSDVDKASVRMLLTTDATGSVRDVRVLGTTPGPAGRALAERAMRAALNSQCATLPLPPSMRGANHTFEVTFRP